MDYFGNGKATDWGPYSDFMDIRVRLEMMGWLTRTRAEQEEQFNELYDFTRRLFKDEQGDLTVLWLRAVAVGKVLWRIKKLSEGEVRKIYLDVLEVTDRRRPVKEPWPLLRKNKEK